MSVPRPGTVRAATWMWFTALGAGVCEAMVAVTGFTGPPASLAAGLGGRLAIYAVVVWVVLRMRAGSNPARLALTVMLGGVGTLSLVYEPISWLAAGHGWRDVAAGADLAFAATAACRVVHLAAVFAGLALMYLPASNRYFRPGAATARAAVAARP